MAAVSYKENVGDVPENSKLSAKEKSLFDAVGKGEFNLTVLKNDVFHVALRAKNLTIYTDKKNILM